MNTAHRLAAGLLLLAAATAQAADIRPGLWEFRSTRMSAAGMPDMSAQMAEMQKQMKNLPPETQRMLQQQMAARGVQLGKDGAVRSCITPEQARQDNIYTGKTDGGCTLASVTRAGKPCAAASTAPSPRAPPISRRPSPAPSTSPPASTCAAPRATCRPTPTPAG